MHSFVKNNLPLTITSKYKNSLPPDLQTKLDDQTSKGLEIIIKKKKIHTHTLHATKIPKTVREEPLQLMSQSRGEVTTKNTTKNSKQVISAFR